MTTELDEETIDFTREDRAQAELGAATVPWLAKLLRAHDQWRKRAFAAVRETRYEVRDHTRRLRESIAQFDAVEAMLLARAEAAETALARVRALVPDYDPLITVVNARLLRDALGPPPPEPVVSSGP